ncbi:cysteine hydrolase family protein [Corynebacterium halotolerans]|uniref:cysteine hydrolase family protein n=1 Tax=Corynebacterium halotolerans TaxID=225326 RepID=UPI003CE9E0CD
MTVSELSGNAVLAVIDMQVAFHETGSDWQVPRYEEAEAKVTELTEAFEQVVWTRFVRDPAEKGAWSDYYDRWSSFRVDETSRLWDLTIDPPPSQPVISLPTFSKWGPELAALVPVSIPLVLCGVATDCCVLSTALGAIDAGRSVIVVTDACGALSDEAQEQTLRILELLAPMVTLATTAEVIGALGR